MATPKNGSNREQRLIESIKSWTGEKLIGDDCAVLPGRDIVTSDMLVEGKHFLLPQIALCDLGWKAMTVNLSDIAAMGGKPKFALVNIGIPDGFSDGQFQELYRSIVDCAKTYKTRIIGGDLTGGSKLVISITVIGEAPKTGCLLRSNAKVGDVVIASGDFGASAAGLNIAQNRIAGFNYVKQRHFCPSPRLKESQHLAKVCRGRGALMDTSDGLADALMQMGKASAVRIVVDSDKIPLHEETKKAAKRLSLPVLDLALYGGEDYELVACISETSWQKLQKKKQPGFHLIGKVQKGNGVVLQQSGKSIGKLDMKLTFQHW